MKKLVIGFLAIISLVLVFSAAGWAAETASQTVEVAVPSSMSVEVFDPTLSFTLVPGMMGMLEEEKQNLMGIYSSNVPFDLSVSAPAHADWSPGICVNGTCVLGDDPNHASPYSFFTNHAPGADNFIYRVQAFAGTNVIPGNYSITLTYTITAAQ